MWDMAKMKNYWAQPEVKVDYVKMEKDILRFWDMERWIYDESRLHYIDTHRPSAKDDPKEDARTVHAKLKQWTLYRGVRQANTPRTPAISRAAKIVSSDTSVSSISSTLSALTGNYYILQYQYIVIATMVDTSSNSSNSSCSSSSYYYL